MKTRLRTISESIEEQGNKDVQLLKKYGVENYTIEDGVITIDGDLDLDGLTSVVNFIIKRTSQNGL